ncbi:unnamed protein product [Fraxinus pennsylvanica]|uniref:Uncharacterized protein n=1 Tax=Fraxinus pennsylvanica TaxID=56036 RepID=A0AAD2A5N8_9LAMI|nr:unnamed protein product [Fraxinus pennsylvanica]
MKVPLLLDLQVDRFIWPLRERSRQSLTTSSQDSSHFHPGMTKEGIRKQYKEKYPNNISVVVVVGKAGGDKWKSMSDEVGGAEDESDKSKFEVNGDEDDESVGDVS